LNFVFCGLRYEELLIMLVELRLGENLEVKIRRVTGEGCSSACNLGASLASDVMGRTKIES
jgi:hypothetical protein